MLYKYVYDKGVCIVEKESSTKKYIGLDLSPNNALVCRFLPGISWAEKENSLLHDIKTDFSLYPVTETINMDKGNIKSFSCVPDSSPHDIFDPAFCTEWI